MRPSESHGDARELPAGPWEAGTGYGLPGMTGSDPPLVSAIITTTGRQSTVAAVSSALAQTYPATEVVVVFDGPAEEWTLPLPGAPRVRLVATGQRSGEGPARAAGTEAARGDYIAFLDDDDTWVPWKLEAQMRLVDGRRDPAPHVLASSRAYVVGVDGQVQLVVPTRLIEPEESVAEYLFHRRRVRWGGALLHPSTILCDRAVAIETTWSDRSIHADWDWLLRLTSRRDVDVLMARESLSFMTETPGSASRAGNWRGSLDWATAKREVLTDGQWADLLLCTTARYAKEAHERRQALRLGYNAVRFGRPSAQALLFFGIYQLGPSRFLTRLARLSLREVMRPWRRLGRTA